MNSNQLKSTRKRRFVGPYQPSVKDYFIRVRDQSTSIEPSTISAENTEVDSSNPGEQIRNIDLGLTVDDLLAMPCTPSPPSPPPFHHHHRAVAMRPAPAVTDDQFAAEMTTVLECIRGRPAATVTERGHQDFSDFHDWLTAGDDGDSDDESIVWTDQHRRCPTVGGRPTTIAQPSTNAAAVRRAEEQRIQALIVQQDDEDVVRQAYMDL